MGYLMVFTKHRYFRHNKDQLKKVYNFIAIIIVQIVILIIGGVIITYTFFWEDNTDLLIKYGYIDEYPKWLFLVWLASIISIVIILALIC